jgi:hypothetical protein
MTAIILIAQIFCGVWVAKELPADWVYNLIGKGEVAAKIIWAIIKIIGFALGFMVGKIFLLVCLALIVYYMVTKKS